MLLTFLFGRTNFLLQCLLDWQLERRQSLLNLEGLQGRIAETGQALRLDLQLAIIVVLCRRASNRDRVTCWSQDISQSAVAHAVLVVYLGYFFVLVDVVKGIGEASSLLHRTTLIDLYLRQQTFMFLAY